MLEYSGTLSVSPGAQRTKDRHEAHGADQPRDPEETPSGRLKSNKGSNIGGCSPLNYTNRSLIGILIGGYSP